MLQVTFRVVPHRQLPGQELVEILSDGKVIAAMYSNLTRPGVKIVSVHMEDKTVDAGFSGEVLEDDGASSMPHIPALHIIFKPSPWSLSADGHVIKEPQ